MPATRTGSPPSRVVGTGLDRVYPARHRELAHRIAARGLIVSEYALGTPPLNPNFPKRNRIIAGSRAARWWSRPRCDRAR